MQRTMMDFWVGLFVMAGIGALLILGLKVGNLTDFQTDKSYVLVGNFENIGGLKVRAPVKSAGVVVGRVTDIQFDVQTYDAVVTMKVDTRYRFPKDTFASILTSGLLGEQYIGLLPGGDEEMLADGEKIMKTNSAIVLEEMIGRFLFDKASEKKNLDPEI
ncbi:MULTISPECIES: outer membrane lipid asymmetry maintenance protein MlaD [Nitrosomonas]|uniref:Phospholipid/cholesterol/gamma-HCH transport system substrate-binding protein n=2 Tax=Nitrosomonas eutropha TaxID=916 RepID=A0ABX5MA85_9PROT|nr:MULTISPECIES: outer membrane lipid asymmetry maintenance protein MlaD [Nitrosomonas]ABI59116.1 Mammalian cell entry related domain protein [Nitrosomonas eutropha C91]MXS81053.1 outer membrane lipid asymmetry maintenance protein MlaD [Nitrosomonas sp. GH22]PXV83915.1 phospholipid/cholesterol/gamma-HCH transport system substrate-binding protein [Nitrosomonas eutropha]SDW37408.1 phospholipid/cholesterol/gamma-HCH transport system substrate-binding protein [Nitrosomonas eutropha]SEI44723.1 phos